MSLNIILLKAQPTHGTQDVTLFCYVKNKDLILGHVYYYYSQHKLNLVTHTFIM